MLRKVLVIITTIVISVSICIAGNWYEDYAEALQAIKNNDWQSAVNLLNSAIGQKGEPKTNTKTYGLRFIDYLPYLYRGIAYYNLGEYDKARSDLGKSVQFGQVKKARRDKASKVRLRTHLALLEQKKLAAKEVIATTNKEEEKKPIIQEKDTDTPVMETPINTQDKQVEKKPPRKPPSTSTKKSAKSGNRLYNSNVASKQISKEPENYDDEFEAALTSFSDGDFSKARADFMLLEKKSPNQYDTQKYIDRINRVEKKVRDGIAAYFKGEHDRSIAQLEGALQEKFINADVHAFLGCAYAAKYYLEGAIDRSLHLQAIEEFRIAKRINPDYNLNERYISPNIIALFRERN